MLQNAVKVTPDQDEDADFQKNPSSRRVSSADIECHNESACGDEDSSALSTVRVAKCDEPDLQKCDEPDSRNVSCTPCPYCRFHGKGFLQTPT